MNHTPGPWTAHDDDGTGTLPCVLSDKVNAGGNFYIAQCNLFKDARLIAAAPDYFAIVEAILSDETLTADHIRGMLRPVQNKVKG